MTDFFSTETGMQRRLGRHKKVGAALLCLFVVTAPAGASEALRPALAEMSEQIAKFLKGQNEDTIAVGAFTGPARASSSSGPGIQRILIEELQKQGIRVQTRAKLEVKGDYLDVLDPNSQLLTLRIKATVLDRQGDAVVVLDKKLDKRIDDRDVLTQVLGINKTDFGAGITPVKESQAIRQRLDNPSVVLVGARVQPAPKSPYGIEVQVKQRGRYLTRQAFDQNGFAFVPLNRNEVFAVNLINDSDHDAAVELTIDGLSMFAFSPDKNFKHVVVPRKNSALIKGWYRNNEISDEFLMTEYSRSAVAQLLAGADQIGTITATFAAAWGPNQNPPPDEGSRFRDPFSPAVGRGRSVATSYQEIPRQLGRVRDVISVRYKKPTP
jgi:hypothetical protein